MLGNNLTPKQKQILAKIEKFYVTEGYFPSTRELNLILKLKSSNTVFSHLKALIKKGYLKKNPKGRIIAITSLANNFPKNSLEPQILTDLSENNLDSKFSVNFPSNFQNLAIPYFPQAIPAGFQAPAEDAGREMLTVDQYLIKNPNNTFALKVKGNSMEKAGIMPGDLLIVEKRTDAKPNQIIVAHLPSGFTVKRLIEEQGKLYLKAESVEDYQIKMEEGTEIWGVVIGIVRKY